MQRKGNIVSRESQVDNLVTVGVDMGGALWATAIHDWNSGRNSYHGLRDKDGKSKESLLYEKIRDLVLAGHRVQVFYEAGRYGYAPVRIMRRGSKHSADQQIEGDYVWKNDQDG